MAILKLLGIKRYQNLCFKQTIIFSYKYYRLSKIQKIH